MLIKGRKHLEQWDSGLPNKDTYLYFSKITSEDNRRLHMREHLEYQRFRLWHCSLPAYPPTCLSSNLCISTILAPTLTHSRAFVLVSPLPNHLSLPPPSSPPTLFLHLFSSQGSRCWVAVFTPPLLRFHRSLFLFPPFLSLSLCLSLCLSVRVSVAAGRRSEDAITAAQEGGWKKKHTRQTAPIPSGLSTPIGPTCFLFFFFFSPGKQRENCCSQKTSGSPLPLALPGDVPMDVFVEWSRRLNEKCPLKSTY